MATDKHLIPIYTSRGDMEAYLAYPYLYDKYGEWIGWVSPERDVFSVHGHYVGRLADGPRILRKVADEFGHARIAVMPPEELKINTLATVPLAPLMPELIFGMIDVLLEQPELLPCVDFGELREDMD